MQGQQQYQHLAYRWFCKLNLEDKVPDHSSLTRIRDRFGFEIFNILFLQITEQYKEIGLVKGERVMTDGHTFSGECFTRLIGAKAQRRSRK